MKRYILVLLAVAGCCICAIGGYAAGAYMQFLYTFEAKQDTFVRDILTAQALTKNRNSEVLEWVRMDAPLQYQFLTDFEAIRNAPLPTKLTAVARMTWINRAWPSANIRSSDRWRKMMRNCNCGIAFSDPKP